MKTVALFGPVNVYPLRVRMEGGPQGSSRAAGSPHHQNGDLKSSAWVILWMQATMHASCCRIGPRLTRARIPCLRPFNRFLSETPPPPPEPEGEGAEVPMADATVTSTPTSPTKFDYDLIVVGSGPAANGCAISSSRRGKKVRGKDEEHAPFHFPLEASQCVRLLLSALSLSEPLTHACGMACPRWR